MNPDCSAGSLLPAGPHGERTAAPRLFHTILHQLPCHYFLISINNAAGMLSLALNTQQLSWESPRVMLSVHKAPFLKHAATQLQCTKTDAQPINRNQLKTNKNIICVVS